MDERQRATLIRNMTDNLPTLRKRMDISQAEFAALIAARLRQSKIINVP